MDYVLFLVRTILLVVAGVVLANVLLATNVLSRLTFITAPLCRASRLPAEAVLAIITTTISSTAGKSALSALYRNGRLTDGQVICSVVMSTFPVVAGESFLRVQAPVAIVLLGPVGAIYIALNLFAALLQSLGALFYARVCLTQKATHGIAFDCPLPLSEPVSDPHKVVALGIRRSLPVLRSVLPILIITLVLVRALDVVGAMDRVGILFSPVMSALQLPGECVAAVVAQFLHFSAGYGVVASLLSGGVITDRQAILTLLFGSMVVITMINIRYSMPFNVSLFGRLGLKLTAVNYACSMGAKVVCILLVLVLL
ncbi:nucleoside recognition domain-containing protein [Methermicoccus shengliensis]|uniref:Nucleoside recognition protein n=1 Tax=Methermicoccus shengliensis TaxID=660064 RepID=A0A832RUU9_9EURY|nr:nucleoside recognition domain-containing protein [Methermicoccus shengliensis]KUK29693.1 MAG: Uncharacterized protein XD62_1237 [Methanosarcinales archeaon 56_1174]MDI3488151.1 hypothetical protein [Methanosarcinales archaeon]HIH69240.1 nucleoside recognition protein [Methermicoccus shengliensis]